MQHLTNTLAKIDQERLARAATGLADGSINVSIVHQDVGEVRALVVNGDSKEYTAVLTAQGNLCSCKDWLYRSHTVGPCKHLAALALYAIKHPSEGVEKERCTVCETPLAADQGFHLEDGNNGRIVESGPYCEPCGQVKLIEARSALESAANTLQSMTSAAA